VLQINIKWNLVERRGWFRRKCVGG